MNDDVVVITGHRPGIIRKKQGIGCNRHKLAYRIPRTLGGRAEVLARKSNDSKREKHQQMGQDQH